MEAQAVQDSLVIGCHGSHKYPKTLSVLPAGPSQPTEAGAVAWSTCVCIHLVCLRTYQCFPVWPVAYAGAQHQFSSSADSSKPSLLSCDSIPWLCPEALSAGLVGTVWPSTRMILLATVFLAFVLTLCTNFQLLRSLPLSVSEVQPSPFSKAVQLIS